MPAALIEIDGSAAHGQQCPHVRRRRWIKCDTDGGGTNVAFVLGKATASLHVAWS
jgi:hypothetical protein